MKLAYILLVHEPFEKLRPLLDLLTQYDDLITIHYDLAVPHVDDIKKIKEHYPSVIFAQREKVEWGEASIVKATLNAMQAIIESGVKPDYVTLLSGSCFPIKSRAELLHFLETHEGSEFIECFDISQGQWVKDGLEWNRWEKYHFCNWRKKPKLFSLSEKIQNKLGIKRKFPFGDKMYMGSQWWTLSYSMIEKIVSTTNEYSLYPFVKRTWIPDEFFFQTLVANLTEDSLSLKMPLMNYSFNHTGIPKIYTHYDEQELHNISTRNKFFTRKVLQSDASLLDKLSAVYKGAASQLTNKADEHNSSLHWFKQYGFTNWITDYPLPIFIVLSSQHHSYKMRDYKKLLAKESSLNVFGDLFGHHYIDFNGIYDVPTYTAEDVALRDYSIEEFLGCIASQSHAGFACYYGDMHMPYYIDALKSCHNVTFVHVIDSKKLTLSEIKSVHKLDQYLSSHACSYKRIEHWEDEKFQEIVKNSTNNNLFLSRVS